MKLLLIILALYLVYFASSLESKHAMWQEEYPHLNAITSFVLEWVSENELLLPMYLQPHLRVDYEHDIGKNPLFRRRKRKVKDMLKARSVLPNIVQNSPLAHFTNTKELDLKRTKPLVLNELLQQNVNSWGNVQYNIPLRLSDNETRTATSVGLRYIPSISQNLDCVIFNNTIMEPVKHTFNMESKPSNWDDLGTEPNVQELQLMRAKPPVLNELLIQNVNTWGNVEYNIPLHVNDNETRTATSIGTRHIPQVYQNLDCNIKEPLPDRVIGRDMVVNDETYKTTTHNDFCVKPNSNKAMEKCDCAANCHRVNYMTDVEKRMEEETIVNRIRISDMKDNYRGAQRPSQAPPDTIVRPPDPEYIFDVIAYGRGEAPCIPEDAKGFRKHLDPYFTEYRSTYRQYNADEWANTKDHCTYYTETNVPRVKGFGPRYKEIWQPLLSVPHRPVQDRLQFKTEYRAVSSAHNPVQNLKRAFITENMMKYRIPFGISSLATWSSGEDYYLAPFAPNPYQTNIAPFMYCSEYCHIGRDGPEIVIDQINHVKPHGSCKQRYIVSKDETFRSKAKPEPKAAEVGL